MSVEKYNKSESGLTVTLTLTGSNFLLSAFKIVLTHAWSTQSPFAQHIRLLGDDDNQKKNNNNNHHINQCQNYEKTNLLARVHCFKL